MLKILLFKKLRADSLTAKTDLAIRHFRTNETTKKDLYDERVFLFAVCDCQLNVKLYELINTYHTDVCFQFHPKILGVRNFKYSKFLDIYCTPIVLYQLNMYQDVWQLSALISLLHTLGE